MDHNNTESNKQVTLSFICKFSYIFTESINYIFNKSLSNDPLNLLKNDSNINNSIEDNKLMEILILQDYKDIKNDTSNNFIYINKEKYSSSSSSSSNNNNNNNNSNNLTTKKSSNVSSNTTYRLDGSILYSIYHSYFFYLKLEIEKFIKKIIINSKKHCLNLIGVEFKDIFTSKCLLLSMIYFDNLIKNNIEIINNKNLFDLIVTSICLSVKFNNSLSNNCDNKRNISSAIDYIINIANLNIILYYQLETFVLNKLKYNIIIDKNLEYTYTKAFYDYNYENKNNLYNCNYKSNISSVEYESVNEENKSFIDYSLNVKIYYIDSRDDSSFCI